MSSVILQPEIVVIGTRRYRKNLVKNLYRKDGNNDVIEPYREDTDEENRVDREYNDEISCKFEMKKREDDEDYKDIEQQGDGTFKLKMKVAESYFGYIIGRNGEKKSTLERETQTTIRIPHRNKKPDQESDVIVIEGKSKSQVASCRNRLIILITTCRHQASFTHILTFPITFDSFKSRFNEFSRLVMQNCGQDRGLDESLFQSVGKVHLTICTLTLLSQTEIEQARELLDQSRQDFIGQLTGDKGVKVHIRGLEYMNDDPSQVDVLYAKIDTGRDERLQEIADRLMQRFVESGLSKKQFDRVKLHATVMNTLRRQQDNDDEQDVRKERVAFDARNVLKLYGNFDFGEHTLSQVHISLRFSTARDSYYECVHKILI